MGEQQTSVTTGWVVKKHWKDDGGKSRAKIVSRLFHVEAAAIVFRSIAEKSYVPIKTETEVAFQVTNDIGFDNLPPSF